MISVGLIGAGRIGRVHCANLISDPQVRDVHVFDTVPERATALTESVGGVIAGTVDEVLTLSDAVVVASPTPSHARYVRQILDSGRPCFCEKPLSMDVAESIDLVTAIDSSNGIVQVGFQRRFDAELGALKGIIKCGDIGETYTFVMHSRDALPPPIDYIKTSGGIFADLHIHDFDLLRWLFECEVVGVSANISIKGFPEYERLNDAGHAVLSLTMQDGTIGAVIGSRVDAFGYDVRMEVAGSLGTATAGFDARAPLRPAAAFEVPPTEMPYRDFSDRFDAAYSREMHHFLRIVNGQTRVSCTARDSLKALQVAQAADESWRTRTYAVVLSDQ